MKKIYFTPGPSQLYFTAEEHLKEALRQQIPSISHRSQPFMDIYKNTVDGLKLLLDLPDDYHIVFTSSATEVWERIIENCVEHRSAHVINGAFSEKFASTSRRLGREVEEIVHSEDSAVDIDDVQFSKDVELIGLAHNETSTGVAQPVTDIYALRDRYPDALIAVDVVSSAPCVAIDYRKIDMAFFSVQKCFGLPAGLGVWVLNSRTYDKAQKLEQSGRHLAAYRQLSNMVNQSAKHQTTSTPNVLNIYLLGKVVADMNTKGIDMIRREIDYKAAVLYHCIDQHPDMEAFIENSKYQSKTTVVAKAGAKSQQIIGTLAQSGLIVGSGYGKYKNDHIRIANFPTHSKEQVELLVDELNKL